jgi:hypothetical protein
MSDSVKIEKTEKTEMDALREYAVASLIIRGITALGALAVTGVIGYLGAKKNSKKA